jgi:plasmid stabilization system protein ParE
MTGYALHPEARIDLDEIWEFIRADDPDAADRMIAEILSAIRAVVSFPCRGHRRPELTSRPLPSPRSNRGNLESGDVSRIALAPLDASDGTDLSVRFTHYVECATNGDLSAENGPALKARTA